VNAVLGSTLRRRVVIRAPDYAGGSVRRYQADSGLSSASGSSASPDSAARRSSDCGSAQAPVPGSPPVAAWNDLGYYRALDFNNFFDGEPESPHIFRDPDVAGHWRLGAKSSRSEGNKHQTENVETERSGEHTEA